jgi:HPt (histidine-containing phosphotransfer) domain-containing protein/HAMP domain-containing protein
MNQSHSSNNLVGILISGHIIRPIRRIREGIRQITCGNIDHKINLNRNDELGELSTALDQMVNDVVRHPIEPIDCQGPPSPFAQNLPAEQIMTDKAIESLFNQSREMIQTISKDILSLTALYDPGHLDITDIIDWDQLVERLGNEDTIRDVIPPCLNDMQSHIGELSRALACEDYRAIVFHTHAIKGTGRYLGIERVTKLATRMEHAGQKNDLLGSVEVFNDLKPQIEKILVALSQDNWIELAKIAQITQTDLKSESQKV